MSKNECGKTRKVDNPYEIWVNRNAGWEWRILKKYQAPENEVKNQFARWYCAVKSPMTYGSWEYGDTYVKDIKDVAYKVDFPYLINKDNETTFLNGNLIIETN